MEKEILYPRGVDSARVIQVIETKSARGSGTEAQPSRIVTEYWSLDGVKLAEHDPCTQHAVAGEYWERQADGKMQRFPAVRSDD